TCDAIGHLLYFGDVTESTLDALAKQGTFGIMVSEAIRFCTGLHPSLSSRLTLVLSGAPALRFESDRPFQRLRYNVRRFHITYLEEDVVGRNAYVAAIEEAIRLHADSVGPLALELLRFRGNLPVDLAPAVFEDFAKHFRGYQEEMTLGIIRWVYS